MAFAFALLATDALTRLRLGPLARVAHSSSSRWRSACFSTSGRLDGLSILKEYANRADVFWTEVQRHLVLAFGSVVVAVLVGLPLGILAIGVEAVRATVLNVLNIVQTIPSIALFGILIAPLAWVAANVPGARRSASRGSARRRP